MANLNDVFNLTTLIEWATYYRPALEIIGLIFASALIGFLCARWVYRSKISSRDVQLRIEHTRSRRRLSQGSGALAAMTRERDRSLRRQRNHRAATGARPNETVPPA
jgi:hypothetical protein